MSTARRLSRSAAPTEPLIGFGQSPCPKALASQGDYTTPLAFKDFPEFAEEAEASDFEEDVVDDEESEEEVDDTIAEDLECLFDNVVDDVEMDAVEEEEVEEEEEVQEHEGVRKSIRKTRRPIGHNSTSSTSSIIREVARAAGRVSDDTVPLLAPHHSDETPDFVSGGGHDHGCRH
jgi:hypothetical protein